MCLNGAGKHTGSKNLGSTQWWVLSICDNLLTRRKSSIYMRCVSGQSESGSGDRQARGQGLTSPVWARVVSSCYG